MCVALEFAVLAGVPVRPDEIVRLMRNLAQAQVVHTVPDEDAKGDE